MEIHKLSQMSIMELCSLQHDIDENLCEIFKIAPVRESLALERKSAKLIAKAWKEAANTALAGIKSLVAGTITTRKLNSFLKSIGVRLASPLTAKQKEILEGNLRSIYKISKKYHSSKAKITFDFSMVDQRAVAAINKQQVFWVGDFYNAKLSQRIRGVSEDIVFKQGLSREEAGRVMGRALRQEFGIVAGGRSSFAHQIPAKYAGNPDLYFELLSATSSHQSRSFGAVNAFKEAEVVTYRLVNPMDERTSAECQLIHGTEFEVPVAEGQMNKILSAKNPDEVKQAAPWLGAKEISKVCDGTSPGSKSRADALERANVILPPFHAFCRTDVVMVG